MSRIRTALVGTVAAGLLLMTASVASAAPVEASSSIREVTDLGGGWFSNSQVLTSVTTDVTQQSRTRTVAGDFTSQIQQPINPDGTSTWPAKRGVIPVQFKLTKSDTVQRKTDTTTTTTVTKVPSFKSIGSDSESHNDWAALTHVPPSGTTVASLTDIRSDFDWLNGSTNHTGSLRWVISTAAGNIDAYYGSLPNFTDNGGPGSGDNLIAQTDARFDPPGGEWVKTWNDIVGTYGTQPVLSVYLVVDAGDQELDLHGATVNGSHKDVLDSYTGGHDTVEAWSPGQPDVVTVPGTWETISTSAGVQTNAVPAKIVVIKSPNDPTPIDVSESLSSAQGDTSGYFRQIDGKYMYNLKAETLGKGSFNVYIAPDGYTNAQSDARVLENPGVFELK
jgi:hypothetical protein